MRELRHNTPKGERAEFDRLMARTKPIMAYLERREEIEAASTTLEEHRAEFEKFSHGHQAWTEEQIAGNDKMLREAGLDPTRLPSMTLGEVESWLRAQQADPASKARMEAIMEANPEQRALAAASLEQMESDSIKLLEREDFSAFLLARQEVEPWQVALNRRLKSIWDQTPGLSSDAPPESAVTEVFSKTVMPVIGEMAKAIFTPERVRQLLSQLDNYRSQKLTADDKHAAGCAMGAIVSLEREPDPARNYFLNSLCYFSLRAPLCDNQPGP